MRVPQCSISALRQLCILFTTPLPHFSRSLSLAFPKTNVYWIKEGVTRPSWPPFRTSFPLSFGTSKASIRSVPLTVEVSGFRLRINIPSPSCHTPLPSSFCRPLLRFTRVLYIPNYPVILRTRKGDLFYSSTPSYNSCTHRYSQIDDTILVSSLPCSHLCLFNGSSTVRSHLYFQRTWFHRRHLHLLLPV